MSDPTLADVLAEALYDHDYPNHKAEAEALAAHPAVVAWAARASDTALREDGQRWRDAEAEGHVVDFTEDGFGLQHPPSCRSDLIGCRFNLWLAGRDEPEMPPGRYRMTWETDGPEYAALASPEGAAMTGPYVNEDGDIWVERGSVPWPQARREAWTAADTGWTWAEVGLAYEGIQRGVLVSDGNDMPCEAAPNCRCCRLIDAYHFRTIEL